MIMNVSEKNEEAFGLVLNEIARMDKIQDVKKVAEEMKKRG